MLAAMTVQKIILGTGSRFLMSTSALHFDVEMLEV
jgi:hypothetical protein